MNNVELFDFYEMVKSDALKNLREMPTYTLIYIYNTCLYTHELISNVENDTSIGHEYIKYWCSTVTKSLKDERDDKLNNILNGTI